MGSNNNKRDNHMQKQRYSLVTLAVAACLSAPLMAAENTEDNKEDDSEVITIIGSHIKRAADIGTLPVTVLSMDDIENTAAMTGDELLRSIPQMGSVNFGESTGSSNVNDARGDVGSVNLRGLGSGNTLVLLNGRRLVNHPGTQSKKGVNKVPVNTVNSNTLPVSGLRSLEVLRDGAAAIYGSDAIAGVVNYSLDTDYVGSKASLRHGFSEGTTLDETTFSYLTGMELNDGKSNLVGSINIYKRNGMRATERPYSASHDRRDYPGLPEDFVGDTQLDNRSTDTPWGEFSTATLGTFHLQPESLSGCVDSPLDVTGVCVDQGSTGTDTRFDRGTTRPLASDVDRVNLYAHFTHKIDDDLEFFSEAIYYKAELSQTSEQNHGGSQHRFNIAADAFYNPFGEEVTVRKFRPVNLGPREVNVDDTSYRVLAGLNGFSGDWDWEGAAFYSKAETNDSGLRVDVRALEAAANSTDPNTAYNMFAGGDINNPNTIGNIALVPDSIRDLILVNSHRDSKTSLGSIDFKASNNEFFAVPAGNAGVAFGLEYRRETFADDRDPLLDGSNPFIDSSGNHNDSSLYGSSATFDASASRDVTSAYAELLVPLLDTDTQYAEIQIAARYESYSDAGDAIKPKVALFWEAAEWVSLRASYTGGFKVPGLQQSATGVMPRRNTRYDPVIDDSYEIVENRQGNPNLKPEDDVNTSFGIVLKPIENVTFTVDVWNIKQKDLVSLLSASTILQYDYILRQEDSSYAYVNRDADLNVIDVDNVYVNAAAQELGGVDFSLVVDFETSFGDFEFVANAANLTKFDVSTDSISDIVIAAAEDSATYPNLTSADISGVGDQIKQDGNPEWRTRVILNWNYNQWGAGIAANYISDFIDTSTYYGSGDERMYLPVDSMTTVDVYASYDFDDNSLLKGTKVRLGARNVGDEEPPLGDEFWHGYYGDYHSNRGRYIYLNLSTKF
ncbi:MAG: iron complex outermembrane receptor protein [Enterobacterales bacterium]|jgi:iron complex outermembrane receptor protein